MQYYRGVVSAVVWTNIAPEVRRPFRVTGLDDDRDVEAENKADAEEKLRKRFLHDLKKSFVGIIVEPKDVKITDLEKIPDSIQD